MFARLALVLLFAWLGAGQGALAAPRISLVGGALSTSPQTSGLSGVEYASRFGVVGGLLFALPVGRFEFELGALYLNRTWQETRSDTATTLNFSGPVLEIPFTLRCWIASRISLGAGAYADAALGHFTAKDSSEAVTSLSYSDYGGPGTGLGIHGNDFGGLLELSALAIAFGGSGSAPTPGSGFWLSARYRLPFSNSVEEPNASISNFKYSGYELLAGLRLAL